jgi:hypothetical protein
MVNGGVSDNGRETAIPETSRHPVRRSKSCRPRRGGKYVMPEHFATCPALYRKVEVVERQISRRRSGGAGPNVRGPRLRDRRYED